MQVNCEVKRNDELSNLVQLLNKHGGCSYSECSFEMRGNAIFQDNTQFGGKRLILY